jgi:hypothetical protein
MLILDHIESDYKHVPTNQTSNLTNCILVVLVNLIWANGEEAAGMRAY